MKFIKGLLKVIVSGIVAVAIICGLLCFYDIKPIHKENPKGNTDFVWLPNSIWVKATEGIAFGKFDANGFNNKSVISNPDIIVLGSSHMEAFNVMQNENSAYLLSQKLNGKYSLLIWEYQDMIFSRYVSTFPPTWNYMIRPQGL